MRFRCAPSQADEQRAQDDDKSGDKPGKTTKPACAGLVYCLVFLGFFGSGGRVRSKTRKNLLESTVGPLRNNRRTRIVPNLLIQSRAQTSDLTVVARFAFLRQVETKIEQDLS